jgi:TolA-binding protein
MELERTGRMRKPSRCTLLCIALLVTIRGVGAQQPLAEGVRRFQEGDFAAASKVFSEIVNDNSRSDDHADAYFLLTKALLAQDRVSEAASALDNYLVSFADHPYYSEARYLKGRTLYLQREFENAIIAFRQFLELYPGSPLVPNAYYWAGECLFSLGKLDDALALFRAVVQDYPRSAKVEAARYKATLIRLHKRENELLKLLNISHQETLKAIEEFQKRERTYEQAIAGYQRRLASEGGDAEREVVRLEQQLAETKNTVAELEARVDALRQRLADANIEVSDTIAGETDVAATGRLLRAKGEALELKSLVLNKLLEGVGK